jgi:hypothetical protein
VLQVPREIVEASNVAPIAALAVGLIVAELIVLVIADIAALKASGTLFINKWRQVFGKFDPPVHEKNRRRHKMRNRRTRVKPSPRPKNN